MTEKTTLRDLAKSIDHSLLNPTLTDADLRAGCELSRRYDVAAACVKPYAIELANEVLAGSDVLTCAVVAFPSGNATTNVKVIEAEDAAKRGAQEVDVVINIGKALGGAWDYVSDEIAAVNDAVVAWGSILKVIFENDYLEDEHIIRLCEICSGHAVAFVKTSSGYNFTKQENGMYAYTGATDHHLRLMRAHCPASVQIKGAGGLRTLDDLLRVREIGVSRIGASATASILEEARRRGY